MEGLPREVLRWVQSLDLAYSVKHVKRDLSNGFLIAEIASRYYDKDVQMHSFDNGTALRIKKDNWGQLFKFFRKVGIDISQEEIDGIIHCEDGVVVMFVNRLYEALTQRTVQKVARRPLPEKQPPFARNTGAAAIRNSLRSASLAETSDETVKMMQLEERVGMHERSLLEEKSLDPERYKPRKLAAPLPSGAPPAPQITVQEITVRQVERSVARLRAADMTYETAQDLPCVDEAPRDLDVVLDECCDVDDFLAQLRRDDCLPSGTVAVYGKLEAAASTIACAVMAAGVDAAFPERVAPLFASAIQRRACPTAVFDAAVAAFSAVGRALTARSTTTAPIDTTVPLLVPVLYVFEGMDAKRRSLLRLLKDLTHDTSHMHLIDVLRSHIDAEPVFLACVSVLAQFVLREDNDAAVVDLYAYYVAVCLQSNTSSLRANAIAALAAAAPKRSAVLAASIPGLQLVADQDEWWETQAQLVVLAAVVLAQNASLVAADVRRAVLAIVSTCFHASAALPVRTVGVAALAPVVDAQDQDATLQRAFVDVLISLPPDDVACLLGAAADDAQLARIAGATCLPNLDPHPQPIHLAFASPLYLADLVQHYAAPEDAAPLLRLIDDQQFEEE